MAVKFRFPKPSANVENATLTAWLKQIGEEVSEGEIVAEITTDKGVIEVEAPVAGVLRRIDAEEGSVLPVGYIIGVIGNPEEDLPDVREENERILADFAAQAEAKSGGRHQRRSRERQPRVRVRATPAARRLAREAGVDLAVVAEGADAETVDETMVRQFLDTRKEVNE